MIEIFVNNEKIDLYGNENVQINDSIQEVKDIGKIFTSYSRTFTVPASKKNNKIFKHFYNYNIVNGFDPREKVKATIKKNGADYKRGFVQMMKSHLKNNKPTHYTIYFTGLLSELKDIIKDDRLSDLIGLNNYNHSYSQSRVQDGFENYLTISNGSATTSTSISDICYPFISVKNRYGYNPSNQLKQINTETDTFTTTDLDYRDLKPAIRITRVIEAIESQYNITFSNDFFKNNADFKDLFLWLNRTKGVIADENVFDLSLLNEDFTNITNFTLPEIYETFFVGTGSNEEFRKFDVNYSIEITGTGFIDLEIYDFQSGSILSQFSGNVNNETITLSTKLESNFGEFDEHELVLRVRTETIDITQLFIDLDVTRDEKEGGVQTIVTSTNEATDNPIVATSDIVITSQVPKIKVIDFLTSLFKMFNLTAQVNKNDVIEVAPLDNFYTSGVNKDISRLVDISDISVERIETIKEFDFNFVEPESFLILNRNKSIDDEYGNLTFELTTTNANKVIGGLEYTINVEFHKMLFERLNFGDGTLSDTMFGWYVSEDFDTLSNQPILFYTDRKTATGIKFENTGNTPINYIAPLNAIGTKSINFGAELDEFTLNVNTNSLFSKFYQTYINRVFSPQSRKVIIEAVLRDGFVLTYKLNDIIIFNNQKHTINKIDINLNTNKAKLELLTT